MQYLDSMTIDVNVHLNFYLEGWEYEKHQDTLWAMERIEEIQNCKSITILHDTQIKKCDFSDIFFSSPRIHKGFQCWEKTGGNLDKGDQEDLSAIMPHALIFSPNKREENILFSWVGMKSTSARVYGNDWVQQSIGKVSNESFGDESQYHADRVTLGIAEVMKTREPLFEHIRARMHIENEEPFWVPYERLLTPYILRDGSPIVVCDVNPTQHIDVSLASGP